MNLLVKKQIGWLLAIGVLLFGCKDEMRLELSPDVQQTSLEFVELTLPTTNLYFDSLRTDDGTTLLVGEYSDDVFGSMKATGYAEFDYRAGPLPFYTILTARDGSDSLVANSNNISYDSLIFDSVTVTLRVAEILSLGPNLTQNLEFYELQDSVFNGVIYLADDEVPLGDNLGNDLVSLTRVFNGVETTFGLSTLADLDLSEDTVFAEFRLNDSYGQEMFDFVASLDVDETDTLTAQKIRFPGIGFVSNGSTGLVGYQVSSAQSNVNIHASSPDSTYIIEFQLASSRKFHHLDRDRTGSDFASLNDRRALDVSNEFVYFNPVAGVLPRIDLEPYFDFVRENEQNDIVIQRAELSIGAKLNQDFFPDANFSRLYFSTSDSSNLSDIEFNINWPGVFFDYLGTLLQSDNTYLGDQNNNALLVRDELDSHNEFSYFPNVFFQDLLDQTESGEDVYSDNLVMVSPVNNSLGQSTIYKDSVKLKLFYVQLN
ncbi:MAG: DUF4270 domain-containing protein [Cytophagales bacterium]|nr:DUF4270 domain-containing protein [Cytophagales bacterium]